jgi:2-iminobutanoate/2-iminopropanoate deaminase
MKTPIQLVNTPRAPQPGGHYSQALIHGDTVYVSGILPLDPNVGVFSGGSIEDQTTRVLSSLDAILVASGSSMDRVLKMTLYVTDISHWGSVNRLCARAFGGHRPARTVVPVKELHHGCLIEIDAVASL